MSVAFVMKSFWWNFKGSRQLGYDLRRVEPYVLAFCADASGQIHRSVTPIYANSPRAGRQQMSGMGHIFYGPRDPGGVLAFAIAVIESDADIRGAGVRMEAILSRPEVTTATKAASDLIVNAVAAAGNATPVGAIVGGVVTLLESTLQIVARAMQSNPDDVMWLHSGSFLADTSPPYQWGRRGEVGSALAVRGRSAFGLEYEVVRTTVALANDIRVEAEENLRSLPSVFVG
ncbi:hypothetical protein [Nannocystis pusilla]|nr:hypothetical protein [Nannocystis pusilla]